MGSMAMGAGMWLMGIVALATLAALIGFGVWALRRFTGGNHSNAVRTLEERFARGEIDDEELNKRRRALRG